VVGQHESGGAGGCTNWEHRSCRYTIVGKPQNNPALHKVQSPPPPPLAHLVATTHTHQPTTRTCSYKSTNFRSGSLSDLQVCSTPSHCPLFTSETKTSMSSTVFITTPVSCTNASNVFGRLLSCKSPSEKDKAGREGWGKGGKGAYDR
jgi:hypothetical protein